MMQTGLQLSGSHCEGREQDELMSPQQASPWSRMPRGATGHARIQTLSLAGSTKVKIQSQESNSAGKGRGMREQTSCGAHVVSSISSDSGIFPHVLCGEFCNQILLREVHSGRSRVDSSEALC